MLFIVLYEIYLTLGEYYGFFTKFQTLFIPDQQEPFFSKVAYEKFVFFFCRKICSN